MSSERGFFTTKQGKQYPTITLYREGKAAKFPVTLGVSKCKLVLAHLEDIKAFVASDPQPKQGVAPADDSIVVA